MHDYPSQVKEKFDSILKNMAENHWLYTNDPGHAFMRQHLGKLLLRYCKNDRWYGKRYYYRRDY